MSRMGVVLETAEIIDGNAEYEKGAVIVRTAESFLRFGHFELISAQNEIETLRKLADFTIENYFPKIDSDSSEKYADFFKAIREAKNKNS